MSKVFCQVVIVPHNLTNRFQPLDITVNKPGKSFISNKCNEWFSMQVLRQLEKGVQPAYVQVSLGLTELKVMDAKWILELYNNLCLKTTLFFNGFKAASITDTVESVNTALKRTENLDNCLCFM